MGNPVKEIPVFDPNKPFETVTSDAPIFDPNKPFEVVKKKEALKSGGKVGQSNGSGQKLSENETQAGAIAGLLSGLQGTSVLETESAKYSFSLNQAIQPNLDVSGIQVDQFGNPLLIQPNGATLSINPKTIPISPAKTDKVYLLQLQERVANGTTTEQDEIVLTKNRNPLSTFNVEDNQLLAEFIGKRIPDTAVLNNTIVPDYVAEHIPGIEGKTFGELSGTTEGQLAQVNLLISQVRNEQIQENELKIKRGARGTEGVSSISQLTPERSEEINRLLLLQKKLATQLTKEGESQVQAIVSTDESGNLLNKTTNRLAIANPLTQALGKTNIEAEVIETKQQLPIEFSTGLNYLRYVEPVQYQRITRALKNGEPISESQIATITAQGIEIQQQRLQDKYSANEIDRNEYVKQAEALQATRYKNITENKETLRALLADGIANYADEINVATEGTGARQIVGKIFGHRWNYTDEEINRYGQAVAKAYGLNPNDAHVQDALKYLADNEGTMILANSISKSGFVRDFAKGLASPIRGISSSIEDIGKTSAEIYAESQSQGNVNVSEKRLKRIDDTWEGTVSSVVEGTGQFVTQAALAYGTSGLMGAAGGAILGRGGVAALAGDIAVADIGAVNTVGKLLLNTKDGLSTFLTSYAQSYDNNLKQAQNYTSDETAARTTAQLMSGLEGATELFLSPLDIARGIGKRLFTSPTSTKGLVNILSDAKILDKGTAIKAFLKGTLETAKVIGAEIGEEEVTQIADYVANSVLNPNSQSFQDRDLMNEVLNTANQTGLSMAIPALISGIGAGNANTFAKGTLLIAAQNRQAIIDDMNERLADGRLTPDQYTEKAQIVNTAETANAQIPERSNGTKLNSEQKADYVFSRVTEAVLNKKLEASKDEAEKQVLSEKIKSEQDFRVNILKVTGNENEVQPQQDAAGDNTEISATPDQPQTETSKVPEGKNTEVVIDTETFNNVKSSVEDIKVPVLKTAIENGDEATVTEVLKEVSDQWHDEGTRAQTERDFGKVITDAAIKLYPQKDIPSLSISENETENTQAAASEENAGIAAESIPGTAATIGEPKAQNIQSQPERTINKDNKSDFTTKSGKQVVSFTKGDLEVKDIKTGEPVSTKTQKRALQEYADNFDYTVGEFSVDPPPTIQSEKELNNHIVENSSNPYELAEVYVNEEPTTQPLSVKERFIADYGIGKVKEASYNEFGDRNNMGMSKAKSYINSKTGRSLDEIAKEMEDHYGIDISPQDLVEFMDRFPNGESQALKEVESDVAVKAANKFKELTGINLNNEIATKAVEQQFNKLSKTEQAIAQQDYETIEQLDNAYWQEYKSTNGFTEESKSSETAQSSEANGTTETVPEPAPTVKSLADRIRSLKSQPQANESILGIPIALWDGSLELIAKAVEAGEAIGDAIQKGIDYLKGNNATFDEGQYKAFIESGSDENTEQVDKIEGYKMKTSDEVNKFLSGETIENVFGDAPEGEQSYQVQKLSDMLQDGKNMIGVAMGEWGSNLSDYGRPLFRYIQKMSNDEALTNKKAVLLTTFLGEIKEEINRNPDRKAELNPLYNSVEAYYQNYMNVRGKEIVAARLLRLYRDKYLGDILANRILEEQQIKDKQKFQDAENKAKVTDEMAAEDKTVTSKDKKDADDAEKREAEKDSKAQSKKNKLPKKEAESMAKQKLEDINTKGGKSSLVDKIKDTLNKLNCK